MSEREIRETYRRILDGWNRRDAAAFAAPFADDGEVIGFDGSQTAGRARITAEMQRIFSDHATGSYVGKIRSVRMLGAQAALLQAVAGVVPAPKLNAVQTLVAQQREGRWQVILYQNTPAQFHGRPDLTEGLTDELRRELTATGTGAPLAAE